jgi:hypothetical protein
MAPPPLQHARCRMPCKPAAPVQTRAQQCNLHSKGRSNATLKVHCPSYTLGPFVATWVGAAVAIGMGPRIVARVLLMGTISVGIWGRAAMVSGVLFMNRAAIVASSTAVLLLTLRRRVWALAGKVSPLDTQEAPACTLGVVAAADLSRLCIKLPAPESDVLAALAHPATLCHHRQLQHVESTAEL